MGQDCNFMIKINPVIMAGGNGTRLWPLSRTQVPKQFLKLDQSEYTLLQSTILRLKNLNCCDPILICNEEHRFLVAEQMREIGVNATIILEPVGKNTAPSIALAAIYLEQQIENKLMLVLAADHVITNNIVFERCITEASLLAMQNKLVAFGIVPTHAETGYGYIKTGKQIANGFEIDKFVEKPDKQTAQDYIDSKKYLWNSGMFVFKAKQYLEELRVHAPDIFEVCDSSMEKLEKDLDFIRIDSEKFDLCRSESVDYAVMERTEHAGVVSLDAGWSDIGSWSALWELSDKDSNGNSLNGDIILHHSKNNYCYSENRLITLLGVDNLIVVDTKDAVLVANKENVQDIKLIVDKLKKDNRKEFFCHREVYRPWGKYDCIDQSNRYQVKRITVNPGQKLSVQMHYHRAEHWIVVSGTAKIHKGKESFLLSENESVYIPLGEVHSLENPGKLPLELIEVQSGSYLGEDDIVRFDDVYGRKN